MELVLETERLKLRELRPSDQQAMFLMDGNPNVHLYLGNNPVTSIDHIRQVIASIRKQYEQNRIGRFAVILKETGEFIGWAGLKFITEPENGHVNFYDIGYRLIEDHWRKGYAYEAAIAWRDYAFEELKLEKLYASAHVDNIASGKILQKIGLKKSEFPYDHHEIPCYWFEMDASDYERT